MRIGKLEDLLKHAEIISHRKTNIVEVGSTVTLKKEGNGGKIVYQVVGQEESDLSAGKISYTSPLGEAILDKKKKDKVEFETPRGVTHYVIVDIA